MPNLITEWGGGLETDKSDYVIYERPLKKIYLKMRTPASPQTPPPRTLLATSVPPLRTTFMDGPQLFNLNLLVFTTFMTLCLTADILLFILFII